MSVYYEVRILSRRGSLIHGYQRSTIDEARVVVGRYKEFMKGKEPDWILDHFEIIRMEIVEQGNLV